MTPASMAAAVVASRLSEVGSAGADCSPTWGGCEWTEEEVEPSWLRLLSAGLWLMNRWPLLTMAALQQASSSTAS
eukprot:4096845-Pleurochrysis_carterae.AAC.1